MRLVFTCLRKVNLTLKIAKCQFGGHQVEYLGCVIRDGEVLPNSKKIEAVVNYKQPVTKTDVKAFLGLSGYYRKFVPQYASISAPLTELLKNGKPEHVHWTAQCEQAFQIYKHRLSESPVFKVPDFNKPFVVQRDASEVGTGAALSQTDENGYEHPVAFAS